MHWFTSDLHFGHKNIIEYAKRPFKDVHEMDAALINNWNELVKADDTVFVIGDISFYPPETTARILWSLKGRIHLIKGNHDRKINHSLSERFDSVSDLLEWDFPEPRSKRGQKVVMCHYAMRTWNKMHYGAWQLYGHSHGGLTESDKTKSMDVGVDCHNYRPISYDQIKEVMKDRKFTPVDHHGKNETRTVPLTDSEARLMSDLAGLK